MPRIVVVYKMQGHWPPHCSSSLLVYTAWGTMFGPVWHQAALSQRTNYWFSIKFSWKYIKCLSPPAFVGQRTRNSRTRIDFIFYFSFYPPACSDHCLWWLLDKLYPNWSKQISTYQHWLTKTGLLIASLPFLVPLTQAVHYCCHDCYVMWCNYSRGHCTSFFPLKILINSFITMLLWLMIRDRQRKSVLK